MVIDKAQPSIPKESNKFILIALAWAGMLVVSSLPDILWDSLTGQVPAWLDWAKLISITAFLGLALVWKKLRPLWQYACILLVFYLTYVVTQWIGNSLWWQSRFGGEAVSFTLGFLGIYILDSVIAVSILVTLWFMKRNRKSFFITRGELNAPIRPVRWLGIREGESWRTFGWIFAIVAALAVMIPTVLVLKPTTETILKASALLPSVILFAAINAFNEEVYYRVSLFSTLPEVIGRSQAQLINITLFGLAHYLYGSPPGLIGFSMTGFLAFLIGKSMLETKGFAWPWFIHFMPDVIVFFSYALLFVQK